MPCRWSRRCHRAADAACTNALAASASNPDVEDWKKIRRFHLRMMRKQVRSIVLLMALMEAMRVGPVQLVYAGKDGYPAPGKDDFGIAHTVGYVISWLYVCAFMIVYVPLFSWWIPTSSTSNPDGTLARVANALKQFNLILLPVTVGICLVQHAYYLIQTFIHVDSRPTGSTALPKNTRKNWAVRAFFVLGIAISTSTGYGAFQILADMDLAHVKPLEYAIIVVPFQLNFGVFLGTLMQFRMEKRIARKEAMKLEAAKRDEACVVDEKAALLQV